MSTVALSVVALAFGLLDRSPLIWSLYGAVIAVAGVAWLVINPRTAGLARTAGADSAVAVAVAVGTLTVVRVLPGGLAVLTPLAAVVAAYAWTTPARSTVPPVACVALGIAWLVAQTSGHPVQTIVDFGKFVAAAALVIGGGWYFGKAALRSLRVVWRHALAVIAAVLVVVKMVPWVRGLSAVNFVTAALVLAVAAVGFGALRATQARKRAAQRERVRVLQTLGEHLAGPLGWTEKNLPWEHESDIVAHDWPANPKTPGAVITARYPKGWPGSDVKLTELCRITARCLGGEWAADVDLSRRWVTLTRQAEAFTLPNKLRYTDLPARSGLVSLGVRADGEPFGWDLSVKAHAHALIFGATGSGKTNLTNIAVASFAKSGALIDLIDAKADERGRSDYDLFVGVPCFRLWKGDTGPAVFTEFCAEMDRRRALPEAALAREPVRLLVVDEMWEFLGSSRRQWAKDNPKAAAKANPLVIELERVARLGRAYGMRLLVGTQTPSVDDIGGRGVRRQLGFTVALGKVPTADTAMIFRSPPPAVDDRIAGRGVVEEGPVFVEVQTGLLDPAEARRIAMTGPARFPTPQAPKAQPAPEPTPTASTEPPPQPADTRQHTPEHTETDAPHARARWADTDTQTHAPEQAPPTTGLAVTCHRCGHGWTTTAKPGSSVRCPQPDCRHSRRVPASRKAA